MNLRHFCHTTSMVNPVRPSHSHKLLTLSCCYHPASFMSLLQTDAVTWCASLPTLASVCHPKEEPYISLVSHLLLSFSIYRLLMSKLAERPWPKYEYMMSNKFTKIFDHSLLQIVRVKKLTVLVPFLTCCCGNTAVLNRRNVFEI